MPNSLQAAEIKAQADYSKTRMLIEDALDSTGEPYTPDDIDSDSEVTAAAQVLKSAAAARASAGLRDLTATRAKARQAQTGL